MRYVHAFALHYVLYVTRIIHLVAAAPVPAVLASQASVVGMVISFLVLHERLSRRQLAGIAALLTGVAIVAATR